MMEALSEIMDLVYMHRTDCEQLTVRLGIWDTKETPYTFYALLFDGKDNLICGESSYSSDTIEEAYAALLSEVRQIVKAPA